MICLQDCNFSVAFAKHLLVTVNFTCQSGLLVTEAYLSLRPTCHWSLHLPITYLSLKASLANHLLVTENFTCQ